ncbi:MAG: nucleotide exchange factor GrpE [Candidatus Gerdarchaeota archaeon]|nr:MAG: nucleotide exchange factor GrpE [Candidatus Gerdarchaeota archaeon]RLI70424.1 MAG: nucleotide exchange factor GrpE [Candidatus Gerdarchaeota archaeon]
MGRKKAGEKALTKANNKENKEKEAVTEPPTKGESDEVQKQQEKLLAVVEETLAKVEERKELKELITKFDKKAKDFKFKDIIEQNAQLLEAVKNAEKERDDYLALLQRFKADFENYKKRAQKQAETNVRFSSEKIISKIFEPIEDIDRAIKFAQKNNHDTVPLEGLTIIYQKLSRILEDEGVKIINPVEGEKFDPRFHEAIVTDRSGRFEPDKVVKTIERGYMLNDRVLRAAKIMVSAETAPESSQEQNET